MGTDKLEVKLTLPRHLAEWLYEFSKNIAMSPDQLIANILQYYYEAWRIGREQSIEEGSCTKILEDNLQYFLNMLPKARRKSAKAILGYFITWICKSGFQVDESSINAFLEEYTTSRTSLKRSTLQTYRYILRRFVKFYKEKALTK